MSKRAAMMAAVGQQGGVAELWTPANGAQELWLDAFDATNTYTSGTGVQFNDKSGNGRHMLPTPATYDATNKLVSLTSTTVFGSVPSITFTGIIAVLEYKPVAAPSQFQTWTSIYQGVTPDRILGTSAQNYLASGNATDQSFINGAVASTNIVLPMGKSIQRFVVASRTGAADILYQSSVSGRSWIGPVHEFIIPTAGLDGAGWAKYEGYLAWKWGLQASLPPAHNHYSAAPTV